MKNFQTLTSTPTSRVCPLKGQTVAKNTRRSSHKAKLGNLNRSFAFSQTPSTATKSKFVHLVGTFWQPSNREMYFFSDKQWWVRNEVWRVPALQTMTRPLCTRVTKRGLECWLPNLSLKTLESPDSLSRCCFRAPWKATAPKFALKSGNPTVKARIR